MWVPFQPADCCTLLSAERLRVALNDSVFPPGTVCQALAADAKYNWLSPLLGGCVFALTFCTLCLLLTDSALEELRNISSFGFFFLFWWGFPPPPPFFILFQFLLDVLGKMEPPTSSRLNSRKRRKDGSGPNGATELDGIPPKMSRRSLVSKQR